MKSRVLVADAELNNALAIVRTLGVQGHHVAAVGNRRTAFCFLSRFCRERFRVPSVADGVDAYVEAILHIVQRGRFDVLLPVSAESTVALASRRGDLEPFVRLPVADHEALEIAHNKERTVALARECGVPMPDTVCPKDRADLVRLSGTLTYPVVVKPRMSAASIGIWYARTREQLLAEYRFDGVTGEVLDFAAPMLQEYVPGDVRDVAVLYHRGELRACLAVRRLWVYPLEGGWAAVAETTDEPELLALARRLLERLQWHGVALVEFKMDTRDGRPKLLEINPKFWGTLQLAISSGLDFPRLLVEMAMTGDVSAVPEYRRGLRLIRFSSGLFGNMLQPGRRTQAFRELCRFLKEGAVTDLRWHDPLPDLLGISGGLYRAVRDTFGRGVGAAGRLDDGGGRGRAANPS